MKQLVSAVLFLQAVIIFGTAGYVVMEKWSILDAFYMTIISLTTTGFAEVHPLTPAGRLFTTGLIVVRSASPLVGKNLADSSIRRDMNVIIIAIYRSSGDFIYNPVSSTRIEALDRLIAIGQQEGLIKLNALCG